MLYFIEAVGDGRIKIGFTDNNDAEIRMATLQVGCPHELRLLGTLPGTMDDEKNLKRRFAAHCSRGEWFEPVPDLIALIPSASPLVCGKAEVIERHVAIRVLTVGRKQFTKALLDQLKIAEALNFGVWEDFALHVKEVGPVELFLLERHVTGDVWGWVKGGLHGDPPCHFRWVIFVHEGELKKCRDFTEFDEQMNDYLADLSDAPGFLKACRQLHERRLSLPGWGDQLFIGV